MARSENERDGTICQPISQMVPSPHRSVNDAPKFEVVACIAGRGFKVRREDMKKLLLATRGKVFTLQNGEHLIACTRLREFRTR
jgi:hypothetical protein